MNEVEQLDISCCEEKDEIFIKDNSGKTFWLKIINPKRLEVEIAKEEKTKNDVIIAIITNPIIRKEGELSYYCGPEHEELVKLSKILEIRFFPVNPPPPS